MNIKTGGVKLKKLYIRKLLSLVMVILMVFPVLVSASSGEMKIKYIYFQDESGRMIFVDYENAINQSLEGDHTLYNAIKNYVGIAEGKGRRIYLEINTGKVLDYRLAMIDNLFRLQDIIGKVKYEVNSKVEYTHELKVVDGAAKIVEKQKEVHSNFTIKVNGPEILRQGETGYYDVRTYGDGKGNTNYRVRYFYTVHGRGGKLEYFEGDNWIELPIPGYFGPKYDPIILTPNWDETKQIRFTPDEEGHYEMVFTLWDLERNECLSESIYDFIVVESVEDPIDIVSITPVNEVEVEFGTTEEAAKGKLPKTTTILDSKNKIHTVNLNWTIENYNGNVEGNYQATGIFALPEGITNGGNLELNVKATVKVVAPVVVDWPIEVENVFVGESQITGNAYANIKIKAEYVSVVREVYVDNTLANNIEDEPSQWRILVEDGTTAEDLRGRIRVVSKIVEPEDLEVTIDKEQYNIDEEIKLAGVVAKENIELENIDITLKIEGEEGIILVEQLMTDKDGKFSYIFKMPVDSMEGNYKIVFKGHEPLNKTIEINFMLTK